MQQRPLILALALSALFAPVQAATPKQQYAADTKQATKRYVADKKLCAEEASSGARMQCTRDAKAEFDKAMAAAKTKLKLASAPAKPGAKACLDCGKVTAVTMGKKDGEGSAVGLIAGGVAGALLGHQVGGGTGKDIATVAGAAGGAYAGKKIEEKINATTFWTVAVQYDNGSQGKVEFAQDPGLKVGDRVKRSGATVVRN